MEPERAADHYGGKSLCNWSSLVTLIPDQLAEKVCEWRQTQDVIIVIHTVDYIPHNIFSTWLDEFWTPVVTFSYQCAHPSTNTHLLLFLVDYSGGVSKSGIIFAHHPEQIGDINIPICLPPINFFPEEEVDIWLDTASDVLPSRPDVKLIMERSLNGIPELVYEIICTHCGFSWGGEFAL